jgi:hypothetical protein
MRAAIRPRGTQKFIERMIDSKSGRKLYQRKPLYILKNDWTIPSMFPNFVTIPINIEHVGGDTRTV